MKKDSRMYFNHKFLLLLLILFSSILFADTTFFVENFNSGWNYTSPPDSWTINNSPVTNIGWDRDSAGGHWPNNLSGYAEIVSDTSLRFDNQDDSLITPIINCNRYRSIFLQCSTFFRHIQSGYTANIIGSIDGGRTYPYTVRNYHGEWFGNPRLESIDLGWAQEKDSVRIAFVFTGNLTNIYFWCLDNVSLIGTYVYDTDAACLSILKPFTTQPPGECSVQVRLANIGKLELNNFNVNCAVFDGGGNQVHTCHLEIDTLASNETITVNLLPTWTVPDVPATYLIKVWTEVAGDENLLNDTVEKNFSVASVEDLRYCEDMPINGEKFPIGEQGYGVKFTPNFYPARVNQVECYLGTENTRYRFRIRVVDDDGVGGSPGRTLYESSMINGNEEWNYAYLALENIIITSGSLYIFYIQFDDVPDAPPLYYDNARNPDAQYYKYVDSSYIQDFPPGDWLLHLRLEYYPFVPMGHDVRTLYIDTPRDEFVRRPFNYHTTVRAKIQNIGLNNETNFAVTCTVKSYTGEYIRNIGIETIPSLAPNQDTVAEFFRPEQGNPWNVMYNELMQIVVRTHLITDQNPSNNYKSKLCKDSIPMFTGHGYGYDWYDSDSTGGPSYDWIEPTDARLALNVGDDTIVSLPPLPFPFPYYDSTFSEVNVSTNGFLSFINGQPSFPNNSVIPSSQIPNCALYPYWDDLVLPPDQSGKIYYQTIGTTPNRIFVITWSNVARKNTDFSKRLNFQVILYENGDIIFQYKDVLCGAQWANYGKDVTIGIENFNGEQGLLYLYGSETQIINWPYNKLTQGRAIKFYKQLWDIAPLSIISPSDTIIPGPVTPQIKIKNCGTEIAETVAVHLSIYNYSDSCIFDTFKIVPRLGPGGVQTVLFPYWVARQGLYILKCSTDYVRDQNELNNVIQDTTSVAIWVLKAPIPENSSKTPSITYVKNGALAYASDFNKIYALKGGNCNEFWCYDIASNTWTQLETIPRLPSKRKAKGGCALTYAQGKIYAFKGGNTSDFYVYDILNHTWTSLAPIQDLAFAPGKKPRDGAGLTFSTYDGLIYAILGNIGGHYLDVLISYAPGDTVWQHVSQILPLGDNRKIRDGGSITAYDGMLYIFKGNSSRELSQYNISTQQWTTITIPGNKNKVKSGGTSTCQVGLGVIYFFIGGNKQSIFKYDIGTNSFDTLLTPIPTGPIYPGARKTKVKKGAALAATQSDLIYAFKSGKCNEFWAYYPFEGSIKTVSQDINAHKVNANDKLYTNILTSNQSMSTPLISYTLKEKGSINLELYSLVGQLVNSIVRKDLSPGNYSISLSDFAKNGEKIRGVYFIKGNIGSEKIYRKIIHL